MVALVGALRLMKKVSSTSMRASPMAGREMGRGVIGGNGLAAGSGKGDSEMGVDCSGITFDDGDVVDGQGGRAVIVGDGGSMDGGRTDWGIGWGGRGDHSRAGA